MTFAKADSTSDDTRIGTVHGICPDVVNVIEEEYIQGIVNG